MKPEKTTTCAHFDKQLRVVSLCPQKTVATPVRIGSFEMPSTYLMVLSCSKTALSSHLPFVVMFSRTCMLLTKEHLPWKHALVPSSSGQELRLTFTLFVQPALIATETPRHNLRYQQQRVLLLQPRLNRYTPISSTSPGYTT
jgi:hypothetical protein